MWRRVPAADQAPKPRVVVNYYPVAGLCTTPNEWGFTAHWREKHSEPQDLLGAFLSTFKVSDSRKLVATKPLTISERLL
jgi:hypothetical protein